MIMPINRATAEQISHYFCGRAVKKAPRKLVPKVPHLFTRGALGVYLQLPIETLSPQRSVHPNAIIAGRIAHAQRRDANVTIAVVVSALQTHLRAVDRSAFEHIQLVRFGPSAFDDDNLRGSMKHVRDAVCAWIVRGDEFSEKDRRGIGKFDDQVLTTGKGKVTCEYSQEPYQSDRTLRGIAIVLRHG